MIGAHVAEQPHRLASFVLLSGGVLLVFGGLTAALGISAAGAIASAAAIAGLLYAGGVWFGASARGQAAVVLFTPQLTVAAGPFTGKALVDLYPEPFRRDIGERCRAAFAGESSRFSPVPGRTFEAAPVRGIDGAIVYGILIAGMVTRESVAAAG